MQSKDGNHTPHSRNLLGAAQQCCEQLQGRCKLELRQIDAHQRQIVQQEIIPLVSKALPPTSSPSSQVAQQLLEPLTQREQEVLHLLADGASNQDIANQLVVSLATAKKHVASILSKLGAENRTQAIARARSLSLL